MEHYLDRPGGTPARGLDRLTGREIEVLALVVRGLSNDEIARALTSRSRPSRRTSATCSPKLAARDRAQLVIAAYESGLVTPA